MKDLEKENAPADFAVSESKNDLLIEIGKNKIETIEAVESVRTEIYENLDEILQNHVNALQEKKLLLLQDGAMEQNENQDYVNVFNNLAEDLKARIICIEDRLEVKVDQNNLEEKFTTIIDTIAQLEAEVPSKTDLNEIIEALDDKSNIDDVNRAFEDVYKILEQKYIDSPLQTKDEDYTK